MKLDTNTLKFRFKMQNGTSWYEFSRAACPICNKEGFCLIDDKATMVGCTRVESKRLLFKNNATYLHQLDESGQVIEFKGEFKSTNNYNLEKLPEHIIDFVYRRMENSEHLQLSEVHRHLLAKRGIASHVIDTRGYLSGCEKSWLVAEDVFSEIAPIIEKTKKGGVPGFYLGKFGWTMKKVHGFLIPFRDEHNLIKGYQIRNDTPPNRVSVVDAHMFPMISVQLIQPNLVTVLNNKTGEVLLKKAFELESEETVQVNGKSATIKLKAGLRYVWLSSSNENLGCGAGGDKQPLPYHVAVPYEQLKKNNELYKQSIKDKADSHYVNVSPTSVWITEGGLKADIASDLISIAYKNEIETVGDTVIAIPGVNTWRMALPLLAKMGVKRVNLAFDMDGMDNQAVFQQVKSFKDAIVKELGIEVYMAIWQPEFKGIDDCLTNFVKPKLMKMK